MHSTSDIGLILIRLRRQVSLHSESVCTTVHTSFHPSLPHKQGLWPISPLRFSIVASYVAIALRRPSLHHIWPGATYLSRRQPSKLHVITIVADLTATSPLHSGDHRYLWPRLQQHDLRTLKLLLRYGGRTEPNSPLETTTLSRIPYHWPACLPWLTQYQTLRRHLHG